MKAKIILISLVCFYSQLVFANAFNGMADMWESMCRLENKEAVKFEYKIKITRNSASACATTRKMCVSEILKEVKKEKYKLNSKQSNDLKKYCDSKFQK